MKAGGCDALICEPFYRHGKSGCILWKDAVVFILLFLDFSWGRD